MKNIFLRLRHVFFALTLLILILPLSARADLEKPHTPPATQTEEGFVPVENISPAPENAPNNPYRLDAGDHLRIYVFGVPDLTGEFHVSSSGSITMPLIGEIKAEGLNKGELEQEITRRLITGEYFNDPKVTVEIIAQKPFYILGEVKNPGSYPYETDLDVFKAIAIAGGYTPRASKDKIIIIRKVHEDKVRINATEDTPLLPGDSIKVEQRFF